ncbi:methyl-accepting chemotaxis protein [Anoxybacteroides amylolyticum]|uniref:Methyl-accepting chemotaxis (MCP) signaling domain protein n=1 Tax=Anoxybacteroides amylolyticum TaxID=294699 RepID=A0A160F6B9_9BACL|nr:methyl-accepting chemotaxis protein [Anoxybacillus amylolyticus]ANB61465.1 methyl-accepting chemotaxis (MCP) signaling domain protein [Anoxybacillus amylolyticus]
MFLLKWRTKYKEEQVEVSLANEQLLGQIEVAADQLKAVIEQMKLAANSLNDISTSSKSSTTELTKHLEKTMDYTLRVSEKMKMIASSALKVSAASQQIHSSSQLFYEELIHSWNSLKKLQAEMDELRKSHHVLLKQMESLVNQSQEINQILSAIGAISQQTSILALNANIESARAGEHGKGFSVVANEVGNLASQTSKAVEQTRDILSSIQNEIAATTDMVKTETAQIESGSQEVMSVLQILDSFKEKLSNITAMVFDSTQAADAQTASVQEIAAWLEQITAMATKNKEHAYKVERDMDRQHRNVEQMMDINKALEKTSNELQSMVKTDVTAAVSLDETMIEQTKTSIALLLESCPLYEMNKQQHEKYLSEFLRSNANIEAVWSNHLDGTFVYSNPPAGLVNAKARPWFIEASKGRTYVSDIYTSALTKRPCLTISAPIFHRDQIVGVVGVDLSAL